MRRFRIAAAALGVVLAAATFAAVATADDDDGDDGFRTGALTMLNCPTCDRNVPILTVGEDIPGTNYEFEAIPDGVSIHARSDDDGDDRRSDDDDDDGDRFDLYVNHETSLVAFNYGPNLVPPQAPTAANSQNDFDNSQLSRISLNRRNEMLRANMAIDTSENFQRFCSNSLGTRKEGFDRPILFTNEEAQDWVRRTGLAWNQIIPAGTSGAEQAGLVVAHDVRNGQTRPIYGMGRHNHENSMAVPGYKDIVVLSGDDTFSTNPASSQLYMYVASNRRALWNDQGKLYALAGLPNADATENNDYFDVQPGETIDVEFLEVPKMIAIGKKPDGTELLSTDFLGMPAPPSSIPNGPQWVLDQWGNKAHNTYNKDVFDFIRIEDTAYDKRRRTSNVVYLADSGRGTNTIPTVPPAAPNPNVLNPLTTSTNGRVWKLELDKKDPLKGQLSVLIQGDDNHVKTVEEIHQPDNVETTNAGSLLVQEDPGSAQQFAPPFNQPGATTARIWRYNLNANTMAPVASVNQDEDEGPTDNDPAGESSWGTWESSGIVDASSILGRGWFYVTIQAHTLWVDVAPGPNVLPPDGPDWTFKKEGGQLIAIRIPGA